MQAVNSSSIKAIGFANGTLSVQFVNGRTYHYRSVPKSVYDEFLSAPSAGIYYHASVKNKYEYTEEKKEDKEKKEVTSGKYQPGDKIESVTFDSEVEARRFAQKVVLRPCNLHSVQPTGQWIVKFSRIDNWAGSVE